MGDNWIKFGSAMKNEQYVEKLLKRCKIDNYKFSHNGYGDYDLYLIFKMNTYKISVNEIKKCLEVFKKDIYRKAQKRKKEYFIFKKDIYGVDCWYDSIKFIMSQNDLTL